MSNASSLVVTRPCALIRESLSHFFSRSEFKRIHYTSKFDEETERHLTSTGDCLWLLGVDEFTASANEAVERPSSANPSVKVVILAASYTANDLVLQLASRCSRIFAAGYSEQATHQVVRVGHAGADGIPPTLGTKRIWQWLLNGDQQRKFDCPASS